MKKPSPPSGIAAATGIGLLMLLPFVGQAGAQSADAPTATTDPVFVFNRVCYAQVPSIQNIRNMATQFAWEAMGGEDLKRFTSLETPEVLEGWDVSLSGKLYRLGIVQSAPTKALRDGFPEFADGKTTACTLILDGNDDADLITGRMNTLARKEPSSVNVPDGELLTTTWSGGNEDFKVFLILKANAGGKADLLNVTILSKE